MCEKCGTKPCTCAARHIKAGLHVEVTPALDDEKKAVARALEFTISSEVVDRDREVISFDGWDLKNYKKNPVVLFGHNYNIPPVAKAMRIWKSSTDRKLKAKVVFPEPEVSSLSDTLYRLYKDGFMSAVSVGFIPKEIDTHSGNERGKNDPWRTYLKQELLEFSLVPVPANPEALITSRSLKSAFEQGVVDKVELDELVLYLKQVIAEADAQGEQGVDDLDATDTPVHVEDIDAQGAKGEIYQHPCPHCEKEIDFTKALLQEIAAEHDVKAPVEILISEHLLDETYIKMLAERISANVIDRDLNLFKIHKAEPTIYDELLPMLRDKRSAKRGDLIDQTIDMLKSIKEGS